MKERAATAASPPLGATERIPRCMSTQHPDNVAMPFFAQSAPLTAEDEVREAYYAFSHLGCDEQMWDFEGKEVDGHVVEKLLSTYESFFAERPIGEAIHLTPRIPNPALEPTQAKVVLEVLQSLPRHADIARVFYDRERPPILALIALQRLDALERETSVAIYPVIGVGSVPFRGGLAPRTVDRVLATYPSVQTFTIQSAFKYDHPPDAVRDGIAKLATHERRAPIPIDEPRALELLERLVARYQSEVQELAPLVNAVARAVPRRRLRKLHVGLFGYNRASAGVSLPRAIPFCASLYSLGLPPEVIGIAALTDADWSWLRETAPAIESELADAARYLDPDVIAQLPASVRESIDRASSLVVTDADAEHREIAREMRRVADSGGAMSELIVRAAAIRHFLG